MYINLKFRIYPNKTQEAILNQQFFVANQAWNIALDIRKKDLEKKNGFTTIKNMYQITKAALADRNIKPNTAVLQQSQRNLESTFKQFFRRKSELGFPRFKCSRLISQSFEFRNQGIQITDKYLQIFRQKIKWKLHREIPSEPKKVIIKRESDGNYFVIFSVEQATENLRKTGLSCGVDCNMNNISVVSNTGKGRLFKIKDINKYSKKFKKTQKKLSKRYEANSRSKNTKKLQKQLNKIEKKVRNIREDYFHKFSKHLVENFEFIRVEKLEIKNMKETAPSRRMRRDISQVSWGSFFSKLKYKAKRYGRVLEEINPAYTSQRYNCCSNISRKNRKTQAKFVCQQCGYEANADINAAKNILDYDKWHLEQKAMLAAKLAKS